MTLVDQSVLWGPVSIGGQETGSNAFAVNYGFTVFVWMYHES